MLLCCQCHLWIREFLDYRKVQASRQLRVNLVIRVFLVVQQFRVGLKLLVDLVGRSGRWVPFGLELLGHQMVQYFL